MTAIEFVKWAQGYYGQYPQGQKPDIWNYIKDLSPEYLDALKEALLKTYSSKWGKPPDIAIFEECRELAENTMMYRKYLPEPEGELISPEEAKRFIAAFNELIERKKVQNGKGEKI